MNIALTTIAFLCGLWWLFQTKSNSTNPAIRFLRVVLRVSGRTIKLALKIAFGVFLFFAFCLAALSAAANAGPTSHASPSSGGPQSEKFYRFVNSATAPVQAVWEGFVTLLGTVALVTLIFFEKAARWVRDNQLLSVCVAGLAFLVWLGFTIYEVWTDEFRPRFDPTLRERILRSADIELHRGFDRHGSKTR
jgi:hypothetical protein